MRYLLPCSCGRSVPIEVAQAGERITCGCGKTLEAPTMRGIRSLALAEGEQPASAKTSPAAWSPLQGGLFAVGAVLLLLGSCIAVYYSIPYFRIDTREAPPESAELVNAEIDQLPVDTAYTVFQNAKRVGLGPPMTPRHVIAREYKQFYGRLTLTGLILGGAGIALIAGSFVAKSPARTAARK